MYVSAYVAFNGNFKGPFISARPIYANARRGNIVSTLSMGVFTYVETIVYTGTVQARNFIYIYFFKS